MSSTFRNKPGKYHFKKRKHTQFYPGRTGIWWCTYCNIPILEGFCAKCRSPGTWLNLSPPADPRPALSGSILVLKELIKRDFNVELPLEDTVVVLNKASGIDRVDEVIVNGEKIGIIEYDVLTKHLKFVPHGNGINLLVKYGYQPKKIETQKGHIKGKFLPISIENAKLIFSYGPYVGYGIKDSRDGIDGIRIRDVVKSASVSIIKSALADAIDGNLAHLKNIENNAIKEIRNSVPGKNKILVSFSGGKDSLVILGLAMAANLNFSVIFNDTGLEYPQTIEYVNKICKEFKLDLIKASAGDIFWNMVKEMGPPAKDYRWCCKVCKLAPIQKSINATGKIAYTLDGRRHYESFSRSGLNLTERNPFVSNQILICPIRNWSALDVWLYILWKQFPYNPIYDMDIQRIGCFLCPSSLLYEFDLTKKIYPEGLDKWNAFINTWQTRYNIPELIVKSGSWRWVMFPPKIRELLEHSDISTPYRGDLRSLKARKISGCNDPELAYTVDVAGFDLNEGLGFLTTIGTLKASKTKNMVVVYGRTWRAELFQTGRIIVRAKDLHNTKLGLTQIVGVICRQLYCSGCALCTQKCRSGAILIENEIAKINSENCSSCGACNQVCPVIHYLDKIFEIES